MADFYPFESKEAAQEHFYPDAWMFGSEIPRDNTYRPAVSYLVICASEVELELAYRIRPDFVDAKIVLGPAAEAQVD
jgi:hypothetical protein